MDLAHPGPDQRSLLACAECGQSLAQRLGVCRHGRCRIFPIFWLAQATENPVAAQKHGKPIGLNRNGKPDAARNSGTGGFARPLLRGPSRLCLGRSAESQLLVYAVGDDSAAAKAMGLVGRLEAMAPRALPPLFVQHGDADPMIAHGQSERLAKAWAKVDPTTSSTLPFCPAVATAAATSTPRWSWGRCGTS